MDKFFERFLGICEDAEASLGKRDYAQLLYDMERTAREKGDVLPAICFAHLPDLGLNDGIDKTTGEYDEVGLISMIDRDLAAAERGEQ